MPWTHARTRPSEAVKERFLFLGRNMYKLKKCPETKYIRVRFEDQNAVHHPLRKRLLRENLGMLVQCLFPQQRHAQSGQGTQAKPWDLRIELVFEEDSDLVPPR